jgi:hypothetical protein
MYRQYGAFLEKKKKQHRFLKNYLEENNSEVLCQIYQHRLE